MTFFENLRLYAAGVQVQQAARHQIEEATNYTAPEPCGWCGSQSGYHTNQSGWESCNNCEGV